MHKKIDISELDIPKDDFDCWDRYPKHRWVYDLSRLLDAQSIKWKPFFSENLPYLVDNLVLHGKEICATGHIYVNIPSEIEIESEVFILKGEIKHIKHISDKIEEELLGKVELRINAFVTLHFQKFTGVISVRTHGNQIFRISLKSKSELALETNSDIVRLIKRIYKKNDVIQLHGPADQILQEAFAS